MFKNEFEFKRISFCIIIISSLFLLCFTHSSFAQNKQTDSIHIHKKLFFVSAGMGVSYTNTPSFNNYLKDEVPFTNKDSIKDFSVGVEFFGGLEVQFSKQFSLKLDYSYFFKSLTYYVYGLTFDYFYSIHQPYIVAYYIFPGKNYEFKFGGGAGYLYSALKKTDAEGTDQKYTSSGLGLKGEVVFAANLSQRMRSYLSGFILGTVNNNLKDANSTPLTSPLSHDQISLNSFGIGARLGFSIKLN
jgi:opacity protein-like surface antigen